MSHPKKQGMGLRAGKALAALCSETQLFFPPLFKGEANANSSG